MKQSGFNMAIGGIVPANRGRGSIKGLLEAREVDRASLSALEFWLRQIQSAASEVGLNITVNDLRRALDAMIDIQKENQVKGFVAPLFPAIYKGVSFNPETFQRGMRSEWLVILDFYALLRQLVSCQSAEELPLQAAIMDAGLYWVVNLLGGEEIRLTAQAPGEAAEQLRQFIISACSQERFAEVIAVNQVRNAYLRAIAAQFPANQTPPVFGLMDVWTDSGFAPMLAEALKLFCSFNGQRWQVNNPVSYERYMAYSPWVTVLVAAEQALLAHRLGFRANLAPTTEAAWNRILDQMCGQLKLPKYVIWMYVRKLGQRLSYGAIPSFSDDQATVAEKLKFGAGQELGGLVINLIKPFMGEGWFEEASQSLISGDRQAAARLIVDFTSPVEGKVSQLLSQDQTVPRLPLENLGWLMHFPAGAC